MKGRDLRVADAQTPATRRVDQLPRFGPRRIFEGGAARLLSNGLRLRARLGDPRHLGLDLGPISGPTLKHGVRENDVGRRGTMAIGQPHLRVVEPDRHAAPVEPMRLLQNFPCLAAVSARVHAQRAADRAGNAAQKRKARDAGLRGRARHIGVKRRRARKNPSFARRSHAAEGPPAQPHDDAANAAVAHDQVGPDADDGDGDFSRRRVQEISQILLVGGRGQHIGRPADTKPSQRRERRVETEVSTETGKLRGDILRVHAASISPGKA